MRVKIILFTWLIPFVALAQDYGIQWVIGYKESVLDFRNDTLINYPIGPIMPMFLTSANICDSSGNLLFYTNGVYIAGSDGNQIANGDSLSPCDYTNQWACCGLNIPQGALFLPMPGNANRYYLFHFSNDTENSTRPSILYYSILDAQTNTVVSKNNVFYRGIFHEGGMTACKHANGRDWWIVIGNRYNTYYKFLLRPDGISPPLSQTIGPSLYSSYDLSYSKFSQDGSKYVTSCYEGNILVMDFNRCSGVFSNPVTIFNQSCDSPNTCSGAVAVEFSSNNRFVYVSDNVNLNQYDLQANNIQDSVRLYTTESGDLAQMRFLQIAPNGKLYATTWNGGFYFLHQINYPDLKGDSCEYIDTGFVTLTVNSENFPNMVNYQLGALIGSGCDTITAIKQPIANSQQLRIMPNPADKYLYVEMGMHGNYEFDLLNENGQLIAKRETRQIDDFDTQRLASGIYFLQVVDKTFNKTITQKIVIQH